MSEELTVYRPRPIESHWGEIILNERVVYAGYGTDADLIEKAKEELANER